MSRTALRLGKCWDGASPYLIWQVSGQHPDGSTRRGYLLVDARQQTRGVRLVTEKPADLKATGSLASLLRKLLPTGTVIHCGQSSADAAVWLTLGHGEAEPTTWVQLTQDQPPEIRIVTGDGTALMRRSNLGTYTKRRPQMAVPPERSSMQPVPLTWPDDKPTQEVSTAASPGTTSSLPEYQRLARDRLARRLKTLRKSSAKESSRSAAAGNVAQLEDAARRLTAALHGVPAGVETVRLSDPNDPDAPDIDVALDASLSPGENLERLYREIKRHKRTALVSSSRAEGAEQAVSRLTIDLELIRATPLGAADVEAMLARHGLSAPPSTAPEAKAKARIKAPPKYARQFNGHLPDARMTPILVGKAAADNDELTKRAQGNDWWLHAVGVTGSHVVIPARGLRGPLPPALLRQAAILALHFSKLRQNKAGEVYVTQRQHVAKKKGMAPGLWQVIKAETLNVRYDETELRTALGGQDET